MAIERIEIHEHEPYGREVEGIAPYSLVRATAHYVIDPHHVANSSIVDLELATGEDGLVRFNADMLFAYPMAVSSMPLLYVVANRGRAGALPFDLSNADAASRSNETLRVGDAFVLRRGFAVLWTGWQWDVKTGPNLLRLNAPLALLNEESPPGSVELRIEVDVASADHILIDTRSSAAGLRTYPARVRVDPEAELLVQVEPLGAWQPIESARWRFGRRQAGTATEELDYITYDDDFQPGRAYRVRYRPAKCPVNGAALLSSRDAVSMLRYQRELLGLPIGDISTALGFGVSQSGRYLRQFLFEGMNVDENGRGIFDGLLVDVAGPRRGEFNLRYGKLSVNLSEGAGVAAPYATDHTEGGLLDHQRQRGSVPKIMLVNSSSEYWRRDASFLHIETDATADFELADDVRAYLIAGTSHVLGAPPSDSLERRPANPPSTLSRWPVLRALLVALERWTRDQVEPPSSNVPTLAAGTAVAREQVLARLAEIKGLALPSPNRLDPSDSPRAQPDSVEEMTMRPLVAAVDEDGNELCGVKVPELAVPTATHLGINPRRSDAHGDAPIIDLLGSSYPFAAIRDHRERSGDPRRSLNERYADEYDYAARVRVAALELVEANLLLNDDVDAVCTTAIGHYLAALHADPIS